MDGLPSCLSLPKNQTNLPCVRRTLKKSTLWSYMGCALSVEHINISQWLRVPRFFITLFVQRTKTNLRGVHGEFRCSNTRRPGKCRLPPSLLHYALPPKRIRCTAHEGSVVQTTTALAKCCSSRLLRARNMFTFYFRKTQKLEAWETWRDSAVQNTTVNKFMCCFPRPCPEKAVFNSHVRETRS